MPRYLPSLIAALITAVLFGQALRRFKKIADDPDYHFLGPGKFHFAAPVADDFTVWHHATASIDGVYTVREPRLPAGTEITITHAGVTVPTKTYGGNYHSGGEAGDKTSVLYFKATEPGDYLITVTGPKEKHAFSISRGLALRELMGMLGWIMATMFSGGLFLLFLILALAKTFPKPQAQPPVLAS